MNQESRRSRALQQPDLRLAGFGVLGALLESSVVAIFAASMSLGVARPAAFVALRLGSSMLFWLALRCGWTRGLKDPSLLLPRFAVEWALQLAFMVLMPRLTVVFMIALLVGYNQAVLHFNRRQFTLAWLLLGAALTGALCEVHVTFGHPGTRAVDIFLLWLFFVLCLARLTTVGRVHCGLREALAQRGDSLSASAQRLLAQSEQERLAERERVASGVHDTLLQELQALQRRFQAASAGLPPGHERARALVQSALEQADRVIEESRERVLELRSGQIPPAGLPQALSQLGASLAQDHPASFTLHVDGAPRPLRDTAADELYRIGREALLNAFRHAGATRIEVGLRFDADALYLNVHDNGRGMEPRIAAEGREGHQGLHIMRARARRIGGQLELQSRPNAGVQLALRLPAAAAFRDDPALPARRRIAAWKERLYAAAAGWVLDGSAYR